jgi:hypothetical protein
MRWAARRLEEVPVVPNEASEDPVWHPLQHFFRLTAFGANVFVATDAEQTLVALHDERESGQEELYVVMEGEAEFELDDDTFVAARGTVVAVPEQAVRRRAVARSSGTVLLAIGAAPGCFATTWRASHFEHVPRADR